MRERGSKGRRGGREGVKERGRRKGSRESDPFLEIESHCVALSSLELVNQAGLSLCLPNAEIKGVHHHTQQEKSYKGTSPTSPCPGLLSSLLPKALKFTIPQGLRALTEGFPGRHQILSAH